MMHFRIETETNPGSDTWKPEPVRYDVAITPLRVVYSDAQQLERELHCRTRVVVVTVIEFESIEIVRVFGDVGGVASNAVVSTDALAES